MLFLLLSEVWIFIIKDLAISKNSFFRDKCCKGVQKMLALILVCVLDLHVFAIRKFQHGIYSYLNGKPGLPLCVLEVACSLFLSAVEQYLDGTNLDEQ